MVALACGCTAASTLEKPTTPSDPPRSTTTTTATTATPSSAGPPVERLDVALGHCFVEPVSFDGERWNVPFERQFGWGGLAPRGWQGSGVMTRIGATRARFEDDGGSVVVFRPVDHVSVTPVEDALCM